MPERTFAWLREELARTDCVEAQNYRGGSGEEPLIPNGGMTAAEVLAHLKGLPLNNLIMAWVESLRPSRLRIAGPGDSLHADNRQWRVTIHVDEQNIVQKIEQEVRIGYGSGAEIQAATSLAIVEANRVKLQESLSDSVYSHPDCPWNYCSQENCDPCRRLDQCIQTEAGRQALANEQQAK